MEKLANLMILNLILILGLTACGGKTVVVESTEPNKLSESEKEAGWRLLFDGETTQGWRNYKKQTLSDAWQVVDGTLTFVRRGGGDIVADGEFDNFELKLEWKIKEKTNSGIFLRGNETHKKIYFSAFEMQILDNAAWKKATPLTQAGANYAMYAPSKDVSKPIGQWNKVHIIANKKEVKFYFNGLCTADFIIQSPDWYERLNKCKFKNWKDYGIQPKGLIGFQGDHGGQVFFRNIKIREIK